MPPSSSFVRVALLVLLALTCTTRGAAAQDVLDRQATEDRLNFLRNEIDRERHLISEAAAAERASVQSLETLERQIALREELIRTYERRLRQLGYEADSLQTSLTLLSSNVDELKNEYKSRAVHAYRYGRMYDFALILAAESINQMIIRVRYLNRFAQQRQRKLEDIGVAMAAIETRGRELEATREQTQQLLAAAESEERTLSLLQRERRDMIQDLRAQRASLEQSMNRRLAEVNQLEVRMRDLFATETSRRREVAASDPARAAEYLELSGSFLSNFGRLPWPTQGIVMEPFGDIVNPVHGTTTPNPGIFVRTRPSEEVRAVFQGEVILVDVMPGFGRLVVLSHGDYKSLYSNFSLIYVEQGMEVEAGTVLGRAGTDAEPKGSGIFFSVFNRGEAVDPTTWLRPN